jgi:hypothetical protein
VLCLRLRFQLEALSFLFSLPHQLASRPLSLFKLHLPKRRKKKAHQQHLKLSNNNQNHLLPFLLFYLLSQMLLRVAGSAAARAISCSSCSRFRAATHFVHPLLLLVVPPFPAPLLTPSKPILAHIKAGGPHCSHSYRHSHSVDQSTCHHSCGSLNELVQFPQRTRNQHPCARTRPPKFPV